MLSQIIERFHDPLKRVLVAGELNLIANPGLASDCPFVELSPPDQTKYDPEWPSYLESIFNYALLDGDINESDDKAKDQKYQVDMNPSIPSV